MTKISTFLIITLSLIVNALGGWDNLILTLILFMAIDYFLGILTAFFNKSLKSENGGLSSHASFIGIFKKFAILLLVMIGFRFDILLEVNFIRDSVIIGFIINETISIIENAALMGIPIPRVLKNAIDILKSKTEGGKK